jgi:hypothetical protein
MYAGKQIALTLAPLLLYWGCSSPSTKDGSDAKGSASEAGKLTDARVSDGGDARKSDGGAVDARNSDTSAGVVEAGMKIDASDRPQSSDSKDLAAAHDANDIDANKDAVIANKDSADGSTKKDAPDGAGSVDVSLPPPPAGTCASPIPIPPYTAHVDLQTTTAGAANQVDMPCAQNGGDVVFSFTNTSPELVYADTFGASWNTILFFTDTCPPDGSSPAAKDGLALCNDDACGTTQSQAMALAKYGTHYLIVSGANGESGDVTVHFEQTTAGGGVLLPLPAGTDALTGTTVKGGVNGTTLCQAIGPDDTYWWATCPDFAGGAFSATTCTGTAFDTVLSLQVPRAGISACNDDDDTCGIQSTVMATLPVGAGLQTLIVDGNLINSYGNYTVTYTRP